MVCNALVACGRLLGAEQQAMGPGWRKLSHNFPHPGRIACCSAPNSRPPATKTLHTICGNTTNIVSSSWWWAYKCPKHVEQIVRAINHSVASSWFFLLYACTTMHGQTYIKFSLCRCEMGNGSSQASVCCISALLQRVSIESWLWSKTGPHSFTDQSYVNYGTAIFAMYKPINARDFYILKRNGLSLKRTYRRVITLSCMMI